MTQKNDFSNTNIRTCGDPRKFEGKFPCAWKTFNGDCKWKGEPICKPVRVSWYIERNIDNLESLEL